jgi:hypothetical protein
MATRVPLYPASIVVSITGLGTALSRFKGTAGGYDELSV